MEYKHSPASLQALKFLEGGGGDWGRCIPALLISGPPGVGKTAFAEEAARHLGARLLFHQLHSWSGADDLFSGVCVSAAVAGDAEHVDQPGILHLAAEWSQRGRVLVCLDELDKAPEPVEALLLDWLQTGRVPVKPGVHLQTRLDRTVCVLTTNGVREHTDALLRRCRRLRLAPLPEEVRIQICQSRSGAPALVTRLIDRACMIIAQAEGTEALSVQEIAQACTEIWRLADSAQAVREALRAWASRGDGKAADLPEIKNLAATIWGEVVAARRRQ